VTQQVVRSNREEVGALRNGINHEQRRGRFNHRTNGNRLRRRGPFAPKLVNDLLQEFPEGPDFTRSEHPREENSDITVVSGAQDCTQLGAENFRVFERVVNAAVNQRPSDLWDVGRERERLIGRHVENAYRDRAP
jgi:hypothetical protein